jgi:hypothetical protein
MIPPAVAFDVESKQQTPKITMKKVDCFTSDPNANDHQTTTSTIAASQAAFKPTAQPDHDMTQELEAMHAGIGSITAQHVKAKKQRTEKHLAHLAIMRVKQLSMHEQKRAPMKATSQPSVQE